MHGKKLTAMLVVSVQLNFNKVLSYIDNYI